MVTVLHRRRHGYDIIIHTNDHPPSHVHVEKGEKYAKIRLSDLVVVENSGFRSREFRRIRKLIRQHRRLLEREWERLHPEQ